MSTTTLVLLGLMTAWFGNSSYFAGIVRSRVIAEIADATGGRVEIGSLTWNLRKLEFDLRNVTVHGLESPNEVPYAHADRIYVKGKVGSLFHRALGLRLLQVDRPIVHVIVYPDGSTNQPRPKARLSKGNVTMDTIFEFSINKADVRDGTLLLNDRPVPLDFAANDLSGAMTWFKPTNRYDGKIHAGKIDVAAEGARPLTAVGDAEFSILQGSADLKSLTLVSGRSKVEINGQMEYLNDPALTVNYRASLDLGETGAIMRVVQLRSGVLDVSGRAMYNQAGFAAIGKAATRNLEWHDSQMDFKNLSVAGEFSMDKDRISLPRLSGQALGGAFAGSVKVEGWCPECFAKSSKPQVGEIRLQLSGLSSREIARAFTTRSLPIESVRPVGTASGTLNCDWKGTAADAVLTMDLTAQPPAMPVADGLPVSARLRAKYELKTGAMNASEMSATTPATHATANGLLGKHAMNLRLSATTRDLRELASLFANLYDLNRLQLELHGQASFNGILGGSIALPTVNGSVQGTDFEIASAPQADGKSLPKLHWDEMAAQVEFGPRLLALHSGVLRHGATRIAFDGTAALMRYEFTKATPFTARVAVNDAQVGDLQAMTGYDYPVTGTADLNMELGGTRASPRGTGRVQIRGGTFYGQPLEAVRSDVAFTRGDVRLSNLSITHGHGRVSGSVAYGLDSEAFNADLRGSDVPLEEIGMIAASRIKVAGRANFSVRGDGTLEAPNLTGELSVSRLTIGGEQVGDVTVEARTAGEWMNVNLRSTNDGSAVDAKGAIRMRDDFQTHAVAQLHGIDIRPLWATYSRGRLTGRSAVTGEVQVSGDLRDWRNLGVRTSLSEVMLPVENMHIRNEGPVNVTLANQVLNIHQLHLSGDGTDLSASGTAQLNGEQKLDLRAEGRADLKLLQTIDPDFTSYGTATVNLRVGGDMANPRTNGRIQIANAGISYIDLPNGLSEINGTLAFNRDRLQIQSLTAHTGGGAVNFAGYVTYGRNFSFNVLAVGEDIRLRYPQGISSSASANLRLTGTPTAATLSGDIVVKKFSITPQFDLATYISKSRQPMVLPRPNSMLYNLKMDVRVTSTPELQVQTALAKVSGNVDLRLRGSAARPSVLGRVNITEGDVSFQGTKYHLDRGDITFSNPADITPVFDIAATTRVRDYDISLGFHGSTDRLTTNYRSDPPLATADIIALLAFGRTREESVRESTGNQPLSEQASNVILGQALNATISSRMQRLFGVSRIKIDPYVGGAANNPSSARVTVEQQVAKDLTVTYITDLSKSNQQIISMEYNISRKVSVVAVRDQYGIVSFDVKIRQRKK